MKYKIIPLAFSILLFLFNYKNYSQENITLNNEFIYSKIVNLIEFPEINCFQYKTIISKGIKTEYVYNASNSLEYKINYGVTGDALVAEYCTDQGTCKEEYYDTEGRLIKSIKKWDNVVKTEEIIYDSYGRLTQYSSKGDISRNGKFDVTEYKIYTYETSIDNHVIKKRERQYYLVDQEIKNETKKKFEYWITEYPIDSHMDPILHVYELDNNENTDFSNKKDYRIKVETSNDDNRISITFSTKNGVKTSFVYDSQFRLIGSGQNYANNQLDKKYFFNSDGLIEKESGYGVYGSYTLTHTYDMNTEPWTINDPVVKDQENSFQKEDNINSFTDTRDGKIYNFKKIGKLYWMTENFNYNCKGSYCYNNSDNCKNFGRLYTFKAAKKNAPDGWRLPTKEELEELVTNYESKQSFNALLGGDMTSDGKFERFNQFGFYWSSDIWETLIGENHSYYVIYNKNNEVSFNHAKQSVALSVRYVKK
jgi:hypothetical protein